MLCFNNALERPLTFSQTHYSFSDRHKEPFQFFAEIFRVKCTVTGAYMFRKIYILKPYNYGRDVFQKN
jgi:hypothetical protein